MVDRLLVIDHKVATPDRDSGSQRMVNLLRVLNDLGLEVTYMPQTLSDPAERRRLSALAETIPFQLPPERSVSRHLRRNRRSYRSAITCRVGPTSRFLPRLRRACPDARVIFDTVDLHHLRELRRSEIENDEAQRAAALQLRDRELALVGAVDATLVVSTTESEILRRECPQALVRVVANIHEVAAWAPPFEDRAGLLFVAGFEHAPNVDAARWLVECIMPLVRERLPDIRLSLVGSDPPPAVRQLAAEDVSVTGYVPDLSAHLERSRLSLAPLRYGAGIKGKITQSLAAGLPVIATSMACEGMPITHGRDILVADEPVAFAAAIARAYRETGIWQRLVAGGLEIATRHFSFAAAQRACGGLMHDLRGEITPGSSV